MTNVRTITGGDWVEADGATTSEAEDWGEFTIALLAKSTDNTAYQNLVIIHNNAGARRLPLYADSTNNYLLVQEPTNSNSTVSFQTGDGWCVIGVRKAAGTTNPDFFKVPLSSGTIATDAGSGSWSTGSTIGASGRFRVGGYGGSDAEFDAYLLGYWNAELSDADIEALATGTSAWTSSAYHVFDLGDGLSTMPDLQSNSPGYAARSGTSITSTTIPWYSASSPPTADAGLDQTVTVGDTANFDGSGSSDPEDGAVTSYSWSITDAGTTGLATGQSDITGPTTATPSVDTSGASAGTAVLTLTVEDSGGLQDTDTVNLIIEAAPTTQVWLNAGWVSVAKQVRLGGAWV